MNAKNQYCTGIYYVYISEKLHYSISGTATLFLTQHHKTPRYLFSNEVFILRISL